MSTATQFAENPALTFAGSRSTEALKEFVQIDTDESAGIWRRARLVAARNFSVVRSVVGLSAPAGNEQVKKISGATPLSIELNWTRLTRANLSETACSRLSSIAARSEGWRGRGSKALSSASLSVFLKFWDVASQDATEPQFALMANGHLSAEWFKNSRRHLDLEFADDWMIYFGLFNGEGVSEGKETIRNIHKMLKATDSRPLRWSGK
jgi:hypothetical protein